MAFVIMAMFIIGPAACYPKQIILVGTAIILREQAIGMVAGMTVAAIRAGGIVMVAAMLTIVTGMYVLASEPLDEGGYELAVGQGAGMHIEAHDTETVPHDKQECRYLYESFPEHPQSSFQ